MGILTIGGMGVDLGARGRLCGVLLWLEVVGLDGVEIVLLVGEREGAFGGSFVRAAEEGIKASSHRGIKWKAKKEREEAEVQRES
jgi:hypothetical protein